jgi:hypothetical protein
MEILQKTFDGYRPTGYQAARRRYNQHFQSADHTKQPFVNRSLSIHPLRNTIPTTFTPDTPLTSHSINPIKTNT